TPGTDESPYELRDAGPAVPDSAGGGDRGGGGGPPSGTAMVGGGRRHLGSAAGPDHGLRLADDRGRPVPVPGLPPVGRDARPSADRGSGLAGGRRAAAALPLAVAVPSRGAHVVTGTAAPVRQLVGT